MLSVACSPGVGRKHHPMAEPSASFRPPKPIPPPGVLVGFGLLLLAIRRPHAVAAIVATLVLFGSVHLAQAQSYPRCLDKDGNAVYAAAGSQAACATGEEARVMTPVAPPTAAERQHAARLEAMDIETARSECQRLLPAYAREGQVSVEFLPSIWRARCYAAAASMRLRPREVARPPR